LRHRAEVDIVSQALSIVFGFSRNGQPRRLDSGKGIPLWFLMGKMQVLVALEPI
jgi:hypothetical protein